MEIKNKGYHKLIVWQKARELVLLIYQYTENFPKSEEFGLKSQLRRATVSVMLTIVEGHRRKSKKDFLHFLNIAMASLTEVEAAWEICFDLKFINESIFKIVEDKRTELAIILEAFIKGLSKHN
ncbi:four helix bundle protein [Candidatus Daviesbacteria bacterium]|nr:four helix bundle protein [Candidatus Daviesbacteria bacterium]